MPKSSAGRGLSSVSELAEHRENFLRTTDSTPVVMKVTTEPNAAKRMIRVEHPEEPLLPHRIGREPDVAQVTATAAAGEWRRLRSKERWMMAHEGRSFGRWTLCEKDLRGDAKVP